MICQNCAICRKVYGMCIAGEELSSTCNLKATDLLTDGGLVYPEIYSCSREVPGIGDGQESAEQGYLEHAFIPPDDDCYSYTKTALYHIYRRPAPSFTRAPRFPTDCLTSVDAGRRGLKPYGLGIS